jgi:hypothetical protein
VPLQLFLQPLPERLLAHQTGTVNLQATASAMVMRLRVQAQMSQVFMVVLDLLF